MKDKCTLRLLDQRELPLKVAFRDCRTAEDVALSIEDMTVRGAPAIGAAAAFGAAIASRCGICAFEQSLERLAKTRPTAVNLFWAIKRMKDTASRHSGEELFPLLVREAEKIYAEDIEANRRLGDFGQVLLPDNCSVITHCNAGALATCGWGTALGVFRSARAKGKNLKIFADETRPRLQGARLTAFELLEDGFDVTLICDSMAPFLMSRRRIDAVVTGADRVAANGDAANKIGTYGLALAARAHNVPFYIAAPWSTVDLNCPNGDAITIEERDGAEVRKINGIFAAPEHISVWNPAFDVTPAELISGIITERGVFREPYNFKGC